jgi:hypothetical protein
MGYAFIAFVVVVLLVGAGMAMRAVWEQHRKKPRR